MLKNGQAYFKNFGVWTLQNFKSMFDYFSILWMKGLNGWNSLEFFTMKAMHSFYSLSSFYGVTVNPKQGEMSKFS